jgi:hypothetical protein
MQVVYVRSYLTKARDFLRGMNLPESLAESECRYSSALLAIHSAIAYSDALRVGLGEKLSELASSDHKAAASKLEKLLKLRNYDKRQGVKHLERLVGRKNSVAYTPDALTEDVVKAMIEQAQRFSAWVDVTGRYLKIEGWRDDKFD